MTEIALNPLDTEVQALINEINLIRTNKPADYPFKSDMIIEKIKELCYYVKELDSQDLQLKEHIKLLPDGDDVVDGRDMPAKINSISYDTLIIYIKNAQLYKMYKPEHLNDFRNHERTVYSNRNTGPVYEVARDSCPQKLIIVLTDEENVRLETMKICITDFLKNHPKVSSTPEDIVIYRNGPNIEFLINSAFLDNIADKERFIDNFVQFLRKKGETQMANKIQIKPPVGELMDTRLYLLPSTRNQIGGPVLTDSLNQLITSAVKNGVSSVSININNYVQNVDNSNTMIDNSVNITNVTSDKKTIKTFCKHIYDTKPAWYKPGEFVDVKHIENSYKEYFPDEKDIYPPSISKLLKNKIFDTGKRVKGTTMKRLLPYVTLKTKF